MTNTAVPEAPTQAARRPTGRVLDKIQWIFVGLTVTTAILLPLTGTNALFIALLLTIPFAAIHGIRRYGWRRFLTFFVVTFVVSNAFESLSIVTGFPFGNYHYTGDVRLVYVPIFIGPIYFGLGYISWLTASTVLDRADERLNGRNHIGKFNVVALPALAAAVMTMFDVASDSQASTVIETWIWHDGGGAQWSISAINETMMTINIFTVVTVAFLALTKIARGDTTTPR